MYGPSKFYNIVYRSKVQSSHLDSEELHDLRDESQQDEPDQGALEEEDHLPELGAEIQQASKHERLSDSVI